MPAAPGSKKAAAGPKLKPLVWQKVPKNRLKGTVWGDLKEGASAAADGGAASATAISLPSYDVARFESLFLAKPVVKAAPLSRAASASSTSSASVSLLDAKRANNIAIILSRLKIPFDEIARAVVDLDAEVLSVDAVTALQKCVPLPEEVELVNAADPATLGYAERFVLALGGVPRLKARLDAFQFKHGFNSALHRLWAETQTLTSASTQLLDSVPLKTLLGMLLHLGNALNAGSHRGGAEGFKLECLTRLAELKTNGTQGSLLQFAVAAAAGLEAEGGAASSASASTAPLVSFTEELKAVRSAAKLSSSELSEEVARLRAGLNQIRDELTALGKEREKVPSEGDAAACARHVAAERFLLIMQPFYDGCAPQLEGLESEMSGMAEAQARMKTYFSEEAKASIDELYSRWATFLGHVDVAVTNSNEDRKRAQSRKDA